METDRDWNRDRDRDSESESKREREIFSDEFGSVVQLPLLAALSNGRHHSICRCWARLSGQFFWVHGHPVMEEIQTYQSKWVKLDHLSGTSKTVWISLRCFAVLLNTDSGNPVCCVSSDVVDSKTFVLSKVCWTFNTSRGLGTFIIGHATRARKDLHWHKCAYSHLQSLTDIKCGKTCANK